MCYYKLSMLSADLLLIIFLIRVASQFTVVPCAGFGNQLRAVNAIDYLARKFNTSLRIEGWHFDGFFWLTPANGTSVRTLPRIEARADEPGEPICDKLKSSNRTLYFVGHSAPNFAHCVGDSPAREQSANLNRWLHANDTFANTVPQFDVAIQCRTCVDCGWSWKATHWDKNLACIKRMLRCKDDVDYKRLSVFIAADSTHAINRLLNEVTRCGHTVFSNREICTRTDFVHSEREKTFGALRCVMHDWYALAKAHRVIASGTTFSLTAYRFGTDDRVISSRSYTKLYHNNITDGCHNIEPLF